MLYILSSSLTVTAGSGGKFCAGKKTELLLRTHFFSSDSESRFYLLVRWILLSVYYELSYRDNFLKSSKVDEKAYFCLNSLKLTSELFEYSENNTNQQLK